MADIPTGIPQTRVIEILAQLEADGEIANVPPPQLQQILDKAKAKLTLKPGAPPGNNPP